MTASVDQGSRSLSIVIPVLNRQQPLAALIAALDAEVAAVQPRSRAGRVELVVVDDGSEPPIVLPPTAALPARLLRHAVRRGANPARATGWAAAGGDYIHFHDSDDGIVPGWLDAVMDALDAAGEPPDLLVTRRVNEEQGRRIDRRQDWIERHADDIARVRRMLALRNCFGPIGGLVFSRRALEGVPFPPLASSQDWALCLLALRRPLRLAIVARARFVHRLDGADRISRAPRAKVLGMLGILRMTAQATPFGRRLRYYQLHRFGASIRAAGRPRLVALWRRAWLARHFWHAVITLHAVVVLGLR